MILSLLISLVICESIPITDENYDEIITNKEGKPVFLKVWSMWCHHCKKMAPEWQKLADSKEISEIAIIVDVECEQYPKVCKRFEGDRFPRIYYINTKENITTDYLGEREFDHFRMFIKKQIQFPLITVKNEKSDIIKYYEMSNITTSFIFCFPDDDKSSLKKSKELVMNHRQYESQFLWLNTNDESEENKFFDFSDQKTKIIAITDLNRTTAYKNSFGDSSVERFLLVNSIPFLKNFTPSVMKHTDYEKVPAFILVHNNVTHKSNFSQESIEISKFANKYYIAATADCVNQKWLCGYTSLHKNLNASVNYLIFDWNRRLFWSYRNKDQSPQKVKKWIENVFANKERPEGPGKGFMSAFLEPIYEKRAEGQDPGMIPYALYSVLIMTVIVLVVYDQLNHKNSDKKEKVHHHHHNHSE